MKGRNEKTTTTTTTSSTTTRGVNSTAPAKDTKERNRTRVCPQEHEQVDAGSAQCDDCAAGKFSATTVCGGGRELAGSTVVALGRASDRELAGGAVNIIAQGGQPTARA